MSEVGKYILLKLTFIQKNYVIYNLYSIIMTLAIIDNYELPKINQKIN